MAENNLYQTGELAEACGTTVRTVQYYDGKGLLAPSGYSEGGRRLYSAEDAERLRFILMLKALGLRLAQIKGVLESPNRDAVLKLLLDEQAESLERESDESSKRLQVLNTARADLEHIGKLMATTEPAMVKRMNDEKARTRKLTCPCCHQKDWCVEHYHADPIEIAPGQCVPGTCHGACEVKAGEGHGGS